MVNSTMPFSLVSDPPRSQVSELLKEASLYAPYEPVALASGRVTFRNVCGLGCVKGLTVPDFDKRVVYRGASGGVHDSEVHE